MSNGNDASSNPIMESLDLHPSSMEAIEYFMRRMTRSRGYREPPAELEEAGEDPSGSSQVLGEGIRSPLDLYNSLFGHGHQNNMYIPSVGVNLDDASYNIIREPSLSPIPEVPNQDDMRRLMGRHTGDRSVAYIRLVEDLLRMPPFSSSMIPPNNVRDALEDSFRTDKAVYKSVLSEDGEDSIKHVPYDPTIHTETKCCPITQVDFVEGGLISELPCGHVFDTDAILKWLKNENAICPCCRYELKSVEQKAEVDSGSEDVSQSVRHRRHPFGPRGFRHNNHLRRLLITRQMMEEEEELQAALLASLDSEYMPSREKDSEEEASPPSPSPPPPQEA